MPVLVSPEYRSTKCRYFGDHCNGDNNTHPVVSERWVLLHTSQAWAGVEDVTAFSKHNPFSSYAALHRYFQLVDRNRSILFLHNN